MTQVRLINNARVVRPLVRQPKFPLLSSPTVTGFKTSDVDARLAQMGISGSDTAYNKMRALARGLALYWMPHPAANPSFTWNTGGDAAFALDVHDPISMWEFSKTGVVAWTATTAVKRGARVSNGTQIYRVSVAGTTSGTSPVHTNGSVTNGTATLQWQEAGATGKYTGINGGFTGAASNAHVPTECTQQHDVLAGFAAALGYQSRLVNISNGTNGHVPFEYFDPELRKWVVVDSTYALRGIREGNITGKLLSWAEVHRMMLSGRKTEIYIDQEPSYIVSVTTPDMLEMVRAVAVKWFMAGFDGGEPFNLPKDTAVILIRSGSFTNLQAQNWLESNALSEMEYTPFTIQVTRADLSTSGVSVNVTLAHMIPNFARYRWQKPSTTSWIDIPGDTVTVPSGSKIQGIDDFENSSQIITVEVVG